MALRWKLNFRKKFLFIHVISCIVYKLKYLLHNCFSLFLFLFLLFTPCFMTIFSFVILKFKKRGCNPHNTPSLPLNRQWIVNIIIRLSTKKLSGSKHFLILYRRRSIINDSTRKPDYMNLEFTGIGNLLIFYWVVLNCNKKGNSIAWPRVGYNLHVFHTVEKWIHVQL